MKRMELTEWELGEALNVVNRPQPRRQPVWKAFSPDCSPEQTHQELTSSSTKFWAGFTATAIPPQTFFGRWFHLGNANLNCAFEVGMEISI